MADKYLIIDEMLKEVKPQGKFNISHSKELTKTLVDIYFENHYNDITIVACGSSYHGSLCAKTFMEKVLKKHVRVLTPESFEYYDNCIRDDELVVVVSFSGASTNSISALQKIKNSGRIAIGITGYLESDFRYIADDTIEYGLNGENEPYSTKGVTLLALYFMLFALEVALKEKNIRSKEYNHYQNEMNKAMNAHEKVIELSKEFVQSHIKNLTSASFFCFLGSGAGYPISLEAKLKFGELLKVISDAQEMEEYIHGPNYRLNPSHTVFMLDCSEKTHARCLKITEAIRCVTDYCYLLTPDKNVKGDHVIHLPLKTDDALLPLYAMAFYQQMVYELTYLRNSFKKHPLNNRFDQIISIKSNKYNHQYYERLEENQAK